MIVDVKIKKEGLLAADDQEMAEMLLKLICSADLRESIAEYNRKNPPSVSWDSVIPLHVSLYHKAGKLMSLRRSI